MHSNIKWWPFVRDYKCPPTETQWRITNQSSEWSCNSIKIRIVTFKKGVVGIGLATPTDKLHVEFAAAHCNINPHIGDQAYKNKNGQRDVLSWYLSFHPWPWKVNEAGALWLTTCVPNLTTIHQSDLSYRIHTMCTKKQTKRNRI